MSKSTTKGATDGTKGKSESKPESKSESKPESKSETKSETKTDSAPAEKSTKGVAAAAHSPSYFSSVSSPKYRAGWDSVFSPGKRRKKA